MTVTIEPFGTLPDGTAVELCVVDNGMGVELRAITLGAIITALRTPDRRGRRESIVLGHAALLPYVENRSYLGAVVGRFANRIAHARLQIDGKMHQLAANDGPHHLHGGRRGFDRHVWSATPRRTPTSVGVVFTRVSPDGEEGYPGTVEARVSYDVSTDNAVHIGYETTTTAPTVVNLTQHTYFDLSAGAAPDALGHELLLEADAYLPVDGSLIPLGAAAAVADTPFDFRQPRPIGERIGEGHQQLTHGRGYDHTWIRNGGGTIGRAAFVREPLSGRTLDVWTTEPGVQFYSGNQLDGRETANGRVLHQHAGFCLETQHFPDSPNQPSFPTTLLRPAQVRASITQWRLGCS